MGEEIEIQLTADQPLVEGVAGELAAGHEARVVETRPEKDEAKLAFDVGDLSTAILVVKAAYYTGKFAEMLLGWMRRRKAKISIRTPFSSVEIQYSADLTEDQVRQMLRKAAEL